jgi:hypothetical protein
MKSIKLYIPILLSVFCMSISGCSNLDHEDTLTNWKWDTVEKNQDIVNLGWTNVSTNFGTLPAYVNVYLSPVKMDAAGGDSVIAYVAVADMSRATFGVQSDLTCDAGSGTGTCSALYTPTEFYNKTSGLVVINGGLFFEDSGTCYSQSLLYKDGVKLSANQNYYSEDWTNFWYPTIGAFIQKPDKTFETKWTYFNDGTKTDYSYGKCKEINTATPETTPPDATTPETATVLNKTTVLNGIGGVGVLIHGGIIFNTYKNEMLDVSADSSQPRTAIAYDATNKRLMFFVCEGRQMTAGVHGLTTAQEATILKALGCTEALNLDGGGSSCMLVNGKSTIKPSDGSERKVIDACYIK